MKRLIVPIALLAATPAFAQTNATPATPAASAMSATPAAPASTTTVTTTAPDGSGAKATTTITTTAKGTTVATRASQPDSKMVCQYTETLGTRLGGHKVCKTKAQWREEEMDERRTVDRAQLGRATNGR